MNLISCAIFFIMMTGCGKTGVLADEEVTPISESSTQSCKEKLEAYSAVYIDGVMNSPNYQFYDENITLLDLVMPGDEHTPTLTVKKQKLVGLTTIKAINETARNPLKYAPDTCFFGTAKEFDIKIRGIFRATDHMGKTLIPDLDLTYIIKKVVVHIEIKIDFSNPLNVFCRARVSPVRISSGLIELPEDNPLNEMYRNIFTGNSATTSQLLWNAAKKVRAYCNENLRRLCETQKLVTLA